MAVYTDTADLRDEADAIEKDPDGNPRMVYLLRWAIVEIGRRRTIIDGLIAAIKGTPEWDDHTPECFAVYQGGGGNCDCSHDALHAAVEAAEKVTE